jgi:FkbM family methyltransferase
MSLISALFGPARADRRAHSVFHEFATYDGWAEPGFERGFYGLNIRDWLFTGESRGYSDRRVAHVGHPPVDEEYFEWIALLTSIAHARGRFCMAELGAGWGRWIASAAMLCGQRKVACSFIGVEAEPSRFELMKMVLRDNGVNPDDHDLLQSAVADRDGEVLLTGLEASRDLYGHKTIRADEVTMYQNFPGYEIRPVPAYSLKTVCAHYQYVDLIDIDVQGAEYDTLGPAFDTLDWKVGMVHIGTHARTIERSLKRVFRAHGWLNAFSYPCHSEVNTRFGRVKFLDGVQTWVNPDRPDLLTALLDK